MAERRYWDSGCFIAWLAEEAGRVDDCRGVIRAAEKGKVEIVTSSLAIAEVVKVKNSRPIGPEEGHRVRMFFRNSYIIVRELDRFIAEKAQELVWERQVAPKDAVHLATALDVGVRWFDTFDDGLTRKSGAFGGLIIAHPAFDEQLELPALEEGDRANEATSGEDSAETPTATSE